MRLRKKLIRHQISCDIFCRVLDNFGDIGVTWRLARQLALQHQLTVRLIVDDLQAFRMIEPAVDFSSEVQNISRVTIIVWDELIRLEPAQLVIEAFAVDVPDSYLNHMAAMPTPPVWINLEYLSAEKWVGPHHLLPSPHTRLPLTKYFFFPGFEQGTGGLIREGNLLQDREAFDLANPSAISAGLRVFLFGYQNAAVNALINTMAASKLQLMCTVPEGPLADALSVRREPREPQSSSVQRIILELIPFTPQSAFDALLWRHEILFVRGEDSFVRAQWAAKPFIWQIYPQSEDAHLVKLDAFLVLYCDGLADKTATALRVLWHAWNAQDSSSIGMAWAQFIEHLPTLQTHARTWSNKLAQMPDLAANLLSFYQKTTKI